MGQKRIGQLLAHWDTMIDVTVSPQSVYENIEEAVLSRGLLDIVLSRAFHREGSLFSSSRECLRVRRGVLVFDIYAALYGNGMFIAWWYGTTAPGVMDLCIELPLVGRAIESLVHPATYYTVDTASFFQRSIHNAVLEVVDALMEANGLRELSDEERVPVVLHDYYEEW